MSSKSHQRKSAYEIRNEKRYHKSYDSKESELKMSYYPEYRKHEQREKIQARIEKNSSNNRKNFDNSKDNEKPRVRDRKSHVSSKINSDYHRQSPHTRGSKKYKHYDSADLESSLTPNKLDSLKKKKEKIEVLSMLK